MAISNTSILIKRSSANTNPVSLKSGELAYSYLSNTLYFGTVNGAATVNIGGQFYTSQIDAATSLATANTIVKRDASGNFQGNISGYSTTANALSAQTTFQISGTDITAAAQNYQGNTNVILNAALNAVPGLTAGSVGSDTSIPVITYGANGRILAVSSSAVSTSLTITDGTTSNVIASGVPFIHQGSGGITATVSANTVTFGTNSTIMRTNTALGSIQVISTDVTIAGNLIINGTTTTVNTSTVTTEDSLIKLASNNNVGDIVDIGFYGQSNTGSSVQYHGLIREGSGGTSAGNFYLFKNLPTDPTSNTVAYASLLKANLIADLTLATGLPISTGVSGLASGAATFLTTPTSANFSSLLSDETGTAGTVVFSNSPTLVTPVLGAATGTSLNVTSGLITTGAWGGTYTADGIVVDYVTGLGRISVGDSQGIQFYANTNTTRTALLSIAANTALSNAIWQGATVSVLYGGTGTTSFTGGGIIVGNGTGALSSLANTTFTATGTSGIQNNTVTSITVDAYGRTTAATYSQILGLTVGQGGTGVSTFTTNGIIYGNGTGAMQGSAAADTSDQTWSNQILTVTNAGVPVWSTALDGGTF
jgi:hypothetical protein